jgi:hypothetical protein
MAKFIGLGVALALLVAGASAKTLKVTKSEVVVQHGAIESVQHRVAPAELVDPAILNAHLQKLRSEGALP